MSSRQLSPCLVCGDFAVGINFGVPTCAPCKAFFRRNAVKLGKIDFVCQEDGDCLVTYQSRRICSCCRLAKCFRMGMKRSLILSDGEREARKELVQQNRLKRSQTSTTRSIDPIQRMAMICPTDRISIYLSSSDQNLLNNIFNAYEGTCAVVGKFHRQYPLIEHSSVHTFVNEFSDRHKSLVEFFKLIPEFLRLSMGDKIRLLRNHVGGMLSVNESILGRVKSNNMVASIRNICETDVANDLLRAVELMHCYGSDPILLKLVLIVRSLSTGINRYCRDTEMARNYDDPQAILIGQNIYVELLWQYILSRSPSDRDAVKFFNKLILDLLFLQRACFTMGRHVHDMESEIKRMDPWMQCMWPKPERSDDLGMTDIDDEFQS